MLFRSNAVFSERFGRPPSAVRRASAQATRHDDDGAITLRLAYRPPLAWDALMRFLGARATPGIERVESSEYVRTVAVGDAVGRICVAALNSRNIDYAARAIASVLV